MKKNYLIVLISLVLMGCASQSNSSIVQKFVNSYNEKDSIHTFGLLHKEFTELWENEIVIKSKLDYTDNYSWGKVMNDKEYIEIVNVEQNKVKTISTYYSDRDKLLEVSPYKSKRIYEIKNKKIYKITGLKYDGYDDYDEPRRENYNTFFYWLSENYGLSISDFPFNKEGAEKLKQFIYEYKKDKQL